MDKKIVVPAEKLAKAVEKHLLPGLLRHLQEKEMMKDQKEIQPK